MISANIFLKILHYLYLAINNLYDLYTVEYKSMCTLVAKHVM